MAVFIPSFFMTGPAQSLFLPLSLAVGFAMGASYLLSSSLVPVLANWMLKSKTEDEKGKPHVEGGFDRFRQSIRATLQNRIMGIPGTLLSAYGIIAVLVLLFITPHIAEEIFPSAASTQFRLRIDAPDGTRVPVTEELVKRVLASIHETAGDKNLDLSLGYIGTQGSSYPINAVFLVDQRTPAGHHQRWIEARTRRFRLQIWRSDFVRGCLRNFRRRISLSILAISSARF